MSLKQNVFVELFSREGRKFYFFIVRLIGYLPFNTAAYHQAFIHRSVRPTDNNERMEYLGDAILETLVSFVLYRHFPSAREGLLTQLRSRLVCRRHLNEVALALGFQQHISQVRTDVVHSHIPGDVLEAFVAALYIDGGRRRAMRFVSKYIASVDCINAALAEADISNHKSELLSLGQRSGTEVNFITRRIDNNQLILPDADNFISEVRMADQMVAVGYGRTKKAAEQQAASKTLTAIRNGEVDI